MDDSTPNYDENYKVNEQGKLEKWVGQIVSVEINYHPKELTGFLEDII